MYHLEKNTERNGQSKRVRVRCQVCKNHTPFHCLPCTKKLGTNKYVGLCSPDTTNNRCFYNYKKHENVNFDGDNENQSENEILDENEDLDENQNEYDEDLL